ncbi:MAG: alpha-amylase family protein [Planctomycetota bacterium]
MSTAPPSQPYRQIHLDFHTGGAIPDVAADFDAEQFARTLKEAHVESVQLFARDWHGWMYYPSSFAEHIHPKLRRPDLLGEQIKAVHDAGLRCPIYTAVQVDRRSADLHPDWCQRQSDGSHRSGTKSDQGVFGPGWEPLLCLNSPFADFFAQHLDELLTRYDCDGFWFDGVSPQDCCCRHCLATMAQRGIDPTDRDARRAFGMDVCHEWIARTSAQVRAAHPAATIFHNAGHVGPRHRAIMPDHTHLELESLPGGGWGYLHFPVVARYARTLDPDGVVGMTGKFHRGWGEFHAYKNQAALEFECFQMLANGGRVSVGDQLPPSGVLDGPTYELIGKVFEQVARVEPYCRGSRAVAEAAVVTSEGLLMESWDTMLPDGVLGATRMLQELGMQFDIVDGAEDLSKYDLLILPDDVSETPAIRAHLDDGGAAILTGDSLSDDNHLHAGPLRVTTDPSRPPTDFIVPADGFTDLPKVEHVLEPGGRQVEDASGAEPLAMLCRPYFERTWDHFCSHLHAPSDGKDHGPAALQAGRVIWFTHKVFTQYRETAPRWCKALIAAAIDRVHDRVLRHDGPSTLLAHLHEQGGRHVLHLLNYVPERRGRSLDVIEEPQTVVDLTLTLRVPATDARAVRGEQDLPCRREHDRLVVTLPRLHGYEVLELT